MVLGQATKPVQINIPGAHMIVPLFSIAPFSLSLSLSPSIKKREAGKRRVKFTQQALDLNLSFCSNGTLVFSPITSVLRVQGKSHPHPQMTTQDSGPLGPLRSRHGSQFGCPSRQGAWVHSEKSLHKIPTHPTCGGHGQCLTQQRI